MSLDAFSPPGDGPMVSKKRTEGEIDPHVEAANGTLWVMGIACLLLAQAMPLVGGPGMAADPEFEGVHWLFGVAMGAFAGAFILVPGAIFLIAAWGIGRRRAWGWIMGLVAFGIMVAFCSPFPAIHGFYALLRSGVRESFE